jgi:hypothetical protein
MSEVGGDGHRPAENEFPKRNPRMRQYELRRVEDSIVVEEEIEVESARSPLDFTDSPGLIFQLLEPVEQFEGLEGGFEANDPVEERFLAEGSADGGRFVPGAARHEAAGFGVECDGTQSGGTKSAGSKSAASAIEHRLSIAEVRAETNQCLRHSRTTPARTDCAYKGKSSRHLDGRVKELCTSIDP